MAERKTTQELHTQLLVHEKECGERWNTAFNHFEKLDDNIAGLNNWIKGGLTTIVVSMLLILLKDFLI